MTSFPTLSAQPQPRHILRHDGGRSASWSIYAGSEAGKAQAIRAAKRIAKRTGRAVEVWSCNEAGTPKAVLHREEG